MTCAGCGREVRNASLACHECLAKQARQVLLANQAQYLPLVVSGSLLLKLIQQDARTHVMLFGTDAQTFCGRATGNRRRVKNPLLPFLKQPTPCRECAAVLEAMSAEAVLR